MHKLSLLPPPLSLTHTMQKNTACKHFCALFLLRTTSPSSSLSPPPSLHSNLVKKKKILSLINTQIKHRFLISAARRPVKEWEWIRIEPENCATNVDVSLFKGSSRFLIQLWSPRRRAESRREDARLHTGHHRHHHHHHHLHQPRRSSGNQFHV